MNVRATLDYSVGGPGVAPEGSIDASAPVAGFYRMKLRMGGHPVGIKVWFGAPLDPVTGEELDRSHRWQALANDRPIDLDRVWPKAGGQPITESEYRYFCRVQDWGEEHAPASPQANPHKPIDLRTAPILI